MIKSVLVLALFGLAVAQFSVRCVQSQRPYPVQRVLPGATVSPPNVQTALPIVVNSTVWWIDNDVGGPGGFAGWNSVSQVGFVTYQLPSSASTAVAQATSISGSTAWTNTGTPLSSPVISGYTNWIANGSVAIATTTLSTASRTVEAMLEGLAGVTIVWPAGAPSGATFTSWEVSLHVMKVTGPAARFAVTVAVVPTLRHSAGVGQVGRDSSFFSWKDLYLGQSLASSSHIVAQYCETFYTTAPKPLDVLFSVDNSGSMQSHQAAVAELGNAIAAILGNAGIDYRVGLVTSAHYVNYGIGGSCNNRACGEAYSFTCRYFTTNLQVVRNWLTSGTSTWIGAGGACGTGTEKMMYGAQLIFNSLNVAGEKSFMPRTAVSNASLAPNDKFRQGANVLVVFLGDADDQQYASSASPSGTATFLSVFQGFNTAFGGAIYMAGIICPTSSACGEVQRDPRVVRGVLERWPQATIGSLLDVASIQATVRSVFNNIVAKSSPYRLSQDAAIGASLQVLLSAADTIGACNNSNNEVPRSRQNGFDIEDNTVILFGGCRPAADARPLVVNYYYWVETRCGDGIVQNDGSVGEECDPIVRSTTDCCTDQCKFVTGVNVPCSSGASCGALNNTCNALGVCISQSCPNAPPGEQENYCTIPLGCVDGTNCAWAPRICLPENCNKRVCIRDVPNSQEPGLMGDCVLISTESGYVCDTDFCVLDACLWCNGDNSTCLDCFGRPNTGIFLDICGVCGGNGRSCCSCVDSRVCGPGLPQVDVCNVCGGNGLSCKNCSTDVGGGVGLDECGVCLGDGQTCLPSYSFQVAVPNGSPADCPAILNAVAVSLAERGYTASPAQLTCNLKDGCVPGVDDICFAGTTMFVIDVRQNIFLPTTFTPASLVAFLDTSTGSQTPLSTALTNIAGVGTRIDVPTVPVFTGTNSVASNGGTNSGASNGGSGTNSGASNGGSGTNSGNTNAVTTRPNTGTTSTTRPNVQPLTTTVEFLNSDTAASLSQGALQILADSQLDALIAAGVLTGMSSDYVATATAVGETVVVSIVPARGETWPGGATTPEVTPGTEVTPDFCTSPPTPLGCTSTIDSPDASSSVESSSEVDESSGLVMGLALVLLL